MATITPVPTPTKIMTDSSRRLTFRVRPAQSSDISEVMDINQDAFRNSEISQIFFSGPDFTSDRDSLAVRVKTLLASPQYRVAVAEDLSTGKLCGFTTWEAIGPSNPLLKDWLKERLSLWFAWDALNRVLLKAESIYGRYVVWNKFNWPELSYYFTARKDLDKEGGVWPRNHIHCHQLAIAPEAQGKGVGKALLKWGMDLADDYKLGATLESSIAGRPLYERNHFTTVEYIILAKDDPAKRYEMPCMLRLPQPKSGT